jgi:hypothetical protein
MGKAMSEFYAERRRAQRAADPDREKMRYSSSKDDPGGYMNWMMGRAANPGKTCRVYCDGKRVDGVVMSDELKGRVTYHPQPLQIIGGEIVTKTLRGAVLVEWE